MSPHSLFSIILPRIFLLYNTLNAILLYLVPKKLRFFIPTSWCPHQANIFNKDSPSLSSSSSSSSSPPPLPSLSPNPSSVTSSPLVHKRLVMDPMELTRVFRMFDRNGDGRVTRKELNDSLENLGIFIPDKELIQIIGKIDVDGDGCVDVDEFGALYQELMQEREEEEEEDMKEAFDVFDQNGDGFITVDELRSVLASLGLKHGRTPEDCQMMITKVDADGDGMVSYKEFKQMMKRGGFSVLS